MSVVNINIRVDSEIKEQAEKLFSELGLNTTTAINVFLRACIREQGIPFEIKNGMAKKVVTNKEDN